MRVDRRRETRAAAAESLPVVVPPGHVACPYCSRNLAVDEFSAWTGRQKLLSVACLCGRTVTMAAVTLRRRAAG